MKIKVPTPEESEKAKDAKVRHFFAGIIAGIIIFGLLGFKVFLWGLDNVTVYTWVALAFGVLSFGFLSMRFGHEFWQRLFGTQ